MKEIVAAAGAPQAIGPYSQAVRLGNLLFVSGQLALDPATGEPVAGGVEEQTRRVMENLKAVVEAAGFRLADALQATCFLSDLEDFAAFNRVYASYFGADPPARVTVQAARLPRGLRVEVALICGR
ncbi:MAG: RidA family protein [Desulfobacterales bacterium]